MPKHPDTASESDSYSSYDSTESLHVVDRNILDALAGGPLSSMNLKKKVLNAKTSCSEAQYYKRLKALNDAFPPRIASRRIGRNVYYSLYARRSELDRFLAKGGRLERHLVENALRLVNELIQAKVDQIDGLALQSRTLSIAVNALRSSHPGLPIPPSGCTRETLQTWIHIGRGMAQRKLHSPDNASDKNRTAENWTKWMDPHAGESEIMQQVWYLYWIEVLQYFREL